MRKLLTLILVCIGFIVNSQVTVDLSFNPIDTVSSSFLGARGIVQAQVIQNDGKILLAGDMTGYNSNQSTTSGRLIRLNADGSRDFSFGSAIGANNTINAIAIQNDGKIIIGGSFTSYAGITVNGICRLNSTGSFDPTFNPGLGFAGGSAMVLAIKIASDGKILVGGIFSSYNTNVAGCICRINTDGSYDATFNNAGIGFNLSSRVRAIDIQADGKILLGGAFNNYNGVTCEELIRINSNGSVDLTFNMSNVNAGEVLTIITRADNKIWIGGSSFSPASAYAGIWLLNSNGINDVSFSPTTGVTSSGAIYTITPISTNKLFIGGNFTTYNGTSRSSMAIINTDGTLDLSLLPTNSYPSGSLVKSSNLNASNSIVYSGNFTSSISLRNNNVEQLTAAYY